MISPENESVRAQAGLDAAAPDENAFSTSLEHRLFGLLNSAQAQLEAGRLDVAAVNLWRTCVAMRFTDVAVLQALSQVFQHYGDIPSIQNLWKRAAVASLEAGDLSGFLDRLYHSIYSESAYSKAPNYEYAVIDEDIHAYVRLAARMLPLAEWIERNRTAATPEELDERPLRIGFVLEGFSQTQAPSRAYLPLAEHHDPDKVELHFYSRFALNEPIAKKERYSTTVAFLEACGCRVWTPDAPMRSADQVAALARRIVEDRIDVLVYQTAYFVPGYNLLSCLRPAPYQVLIEHQQPEHSQTVDLICTTRKAALESSAETAHFPISFAKEVPASSDRKALGLPGNAVVLVSANRAQRYGQPEFWREIVALLDRHENAVFVAVGLDDATPFLSGNEALAGRVITPGYRDDVMAFLAAADVYVDVFPSGGGSSTVEAMTVGLPVVTFEQDLASPYQTNAETLAEYVEDDDLVVPRADAAAWHGVMSRLIVDAAFRSEKSAAMKSQAARFEPRAVAARFFKDVIERFASALSTARAA